MENITEWLKTSGIVILIIVVVAWLILHFGSRIIRKIIRRVITAEDAASTERSRELREKTLYRILNSIFRVIVFFTAFLMILSELGVNIAPLFASAGILSLAIGFGSQSLVKDVVAGVFILVENQYRVGDVVDLEGVQGRVIAMSLRVTIVRTLDGSVHYIPNGSIKKATNTTKSYSNVSFAIKFEYGTDMNKVEEIINRQGEKLAKSAEWKDQIIEAPRFFSVSKIDGGSIEVQVLGRTKADKQWGVASALKSQLVEVFSKEKIVLK